ncbi:hypothetical protein PC118_g18329 [Phytophthora cactorum]|uniref:Uncharacterized protein n=1 Tax=Phytophthora cactorum TaxID=29920 RepID=A0A8T1FAD7_9STRA|nr:hypothetical protein PC118_g18329 [Phytophthora cactorum]
MRSEAGAVARDDFIAATQAPSRKSHVASANKTDEPLCLTSFVPLRRLHSLTYHRLQREGSSPRGIGIDTLERSLRRENLSVVAGCGVQDLTRTSSEQPFRIQPRSPPCRRTT